MKSILPSITYIVRFIHRDSSEIEEYEYTAGPAARAHFELFDETDADLYTRIELTAYSWPHHTATLLASKDFAA